MNDIYDVVIIGGGTAGTAAAYIAALSGLKTALVEKNIHLGGTITSGLVVPAMKTNDGDINNAFFKDLVQYASSYNAQFTYIDGNKGWFNTELLKIVLDEMLTLAGVDILFSTDFDSAQKLDNSNFNINIKHKTLSLYIESKYIIDATGDGIVSQSLGCEFLNSEDSAQALTLRFVMSNVDVKKFAKWITNIDSNRNTTTCAITDAQVHLSTACTWDNNINWALKPLFAMAVQNGDLLDIDAAYFQVFTMPDMTDSIAFNCPRIVLSSSEDIRNPIVYTKALIQGRQQILRIAAFCKKYLKGFSKAYISNIADMLGIRESNRVEGQYIYTEEDIINKKEFDNIALSTDYPIDIHSNKKDSDKLEFIQGNYFLPVEALISKKYDNLLVIGRCLSASFKAQAALRTQTSCFSMGEAAAKYIKSKLL